MNSETRPPRPAERALQTPVLPVLLTILLSTPAGAYLVQNSEFTNDLAGWSAGGWVHDPVVGLFFAGSAEATGTGTFTISQCASVAASDPAGGLGAAATFRTDYDAVPAGYTVRLELFSAANCAGTLVASSEEAPDSLPIDDEWFTLFTVVAMQPGVVSARLTAEARHGSENLSTFLDVPNLRDNLALGTDFTSAGQLDSWSQNPPDTGPAGDLIAHDTTTITPSNPLGAMEITVGPVPARGVDGGYVDVRQCRNLSEVPLSPTLFSYLHVLTPSGASQVRNAETAFIWFDEANCLGTGLGQAQFSVQPLLFDVWWGFVHFMAVPVDAASVQLVFIVNPKPIASGGSEPGAKVLIDDWILAPSDAIFRDGFESGNLTAW